MEQTIIDYRLLRFRGAKIADAEQGEAGDMWTKR